EHGRFYDVQTLHCPDGQLLGIYRKAHLFSLEKQQFVAGDSPLVVETPIGRIGMSICYDLIFPEYIRRIVDLGADIVINSTDWITNSYQSSVWGWSGKIMQGLAATGRSRMVSSSAWRTASAGRQALIPWAGHASPRRPACFSARSRTSRAS